MRTDYKMLGKRIRRRRQYMELSQDALGKQCGFSKTHISNVENAYTVPSLETLLAICDVLDTTPDTFLLGNVRDNEALQFRELCERLLLCSEQEREIVYKLVDVMVVEKPTNKG